MVASEPSPISISPSPVMTATRRSRLRQRQAEPDHGGAAHGAPQIEVAVVVAERRPDPRWSSRGRARPGDRRRGRRAAWPWRRGAPVSLAHLVHTFLPISCCDSSTAAMRSSPNTCCTARSAAPSTSSGVRHAIDFRLAQLEHRIDDRAHRHLPGIELLPLAAHGDQHQQRKAAGPCKRQHVDAIAEPARLHQQRGALAAEPGAGGQRHALLLGGEHDVADVAGRRGSARSAAHGRHRAHSRPGGCRRA